VCVLVSIVEFLLRVRVEEVGGWGQSLFTVSHRDRKFTSTKTSGWNFGPKFRASVLLLPAKSFKFQSHSRDRSHG
jgi:hypothetical protein